jgi:site-specific recombinase XerD
MGQVLSAPYAGVYEGYLAYEQPRVSGQGYETVRKQAYRVLQWLAGAGTGLEEATINDCIRYRNEQAGRVKEDGTAVSTGTGWNRLKAGKRLFSYLVLTGKRNTNPFEAVVPPRLPEHISRNVLTEAQMGRLLDTLGRFEGEGKSREGLGRYRFHVVAEFLYATGLRIAEAAALVPANIDAEQRRVYVAEGKGGKGRTAFMTGYAAGVMERYLARGRPAVLGGFSRRYGGTVFGAHPQRLMAVVNRGLEGACTALGLPVITSHGFRHSLGTHLLHAGCDMRHIQGILGHEALATTQVYTKVYTDDLRRSLDAFHPRKGWTV